MMYFVYNHTLSTFCAKLFTFLSYDKDLHAGSIYPPPSFAVPNRLEVFVNPLNLKYKVKYTLTMVREIGISIYRTYKQLGYIKTMSLMVTRILQNMQGIFFLCFLWFVIWKNADSYIPLHIKIQIISWVIY